MINWREEGRRACSLSPTNPSRPQWRISRVRSHDVSPLHRILLVCRIYLSVTIKARHCFLCSWCTQSVTAQFCCGLVFHQLKLQRYSFLLAWWRRIHTSVIPNPEFLFSQCKVRFSEVRRHWNEDAQSWYGAPFQCTVMRLCKSTFHNFSTIILSLYWSLFFLFSFFFNK